MGNVMELYNYALRIIVSIVISYALILISAWIMPKLKNTPIRILNPTEYFPEEQVKTLNKSII